MKFQAMKEFLILAETLNFQEAADRLFVSQATLSKHIRELENELNVSLFKRTTRKVELTEAGVLTIPYARQITELYSAYFDELQDYKERIKSSLVMGCINHWDVIDLSSLTRDFRKLHPNIRVQIVTGETDELLSMLQQDILHFAIVREEMEYPDDGMQRVPLCEDPLRLFLPRSHLLSGHKSVSLEQLRGDAFIMGADGSLSLRMGLQACGKAGFHPSIVFQGRGPQAMNYISNGLAVGLMFDNPVEKAAVAGGVVCVDLEPKVAASINIAYKDSRLTDQSKEFLSFLREYKI